MSLLSWKLCMVWCRPLQFWTLRLFYLLMFSDLRRKASSLAWPVDGPMWVPFTNWPCLFEELKSCYWVSYSLPSCLSTTYWATVLSKTWLSLRGEDNGLPYLNLFTCLLRLSLMTAAAAVSFLGLILPMLPPTLSFLVASIFTGD